MSKTDSQLLNISLSIDRDIMEVARVIILRASHAYSLAYSPVGYGLG